MFDDLNKDSVKCNGLFLEIVRFHINCSAVCHIIQQIKKKKNQWLTNNQINKSAN